MVTLLLFRHAKSAWDSPGKGDFERPLAPRGETAAALMGQYIAQQGLEPDLVLCSSAVRAMQTLELARAAWKSEPEIRFEEKLYLASDARMLAFVNAIPGECNCIMMVGHNPGMHMLAVGLALRGDGLDLTQMGQKFPTAALAIIDFESGWNDVQEDTGTLRRFVTPRNVA